MQDSLIRSSLRAFLIAFFSFLGILLSIVAITLFVSFLSESDETIPSNYSPEIKPNAEGIRKKLSNSSPVILELDINGVIGAIDLTQEKIEHLLMESRENTLADDRVKGILLRINSPGGTITDADGIYRALKDYKARHHVPIYAFTDGLCASGGMYVACAADKVYASDVTIAGSIGVITGSYVNVYQLMEKLGVKALTLSEGKGKDELNPMRPWAPDEDKNIKEIIQYYYASFVDIITSNRPQVSKEELVNTYGAKVFPAVAAAKIGYIDEAGATRNSTLKKLLTALSIEDDYYQVISLKSTNWLSQLVNSESPALTGTVKHELTLEGQLPKELLGKPLYLYKP
jgi:protease-4